ncbi:MAG: hypothetical protein ABI120_23255 [Gemmatimonadaceae bacterium]
MMQSPRSLRTLDVLSGLGLLIAFGLYFWPVRVSVPSATVATESKFFTGAAATTANENDATVVVASNILSSGRRAPGVRYTSPDLLPGPDYSMPAAFATVTDTDSAKARADEPDAVPSLYGIVNSDGMWRALLRLAESDASPILLREGDRRGSYVVVSIRPNAVVVAGPAGQRTLRLTRASRTDSTGKSL